ncbi:hypothetical protein [Nocardioides sp. TF02-7]|uniref:hypothetical protein n=1 Tax=Nocardioides sp. TF02-7 TaxID=2917724 RepID=UPI001F050A41|nr:hypothetical protein [Nocardioides sp. TF02-7]UMG93921.1 hypothetical protein MF408_07375 [Nocardioides sp. TF02-7]
MPTTTAFGPTRRIEECRLRSSDSPVAEVIVPSAWRLIWSSTLSPEAFSSKVIVSE